MDMKWLAFSLIVTFNHAGWKLFPSPPSLPCHPSNCPPQPSMIRPKGPEVWRGLEVPFAPPSPSPSRSLSASGLWGQKLKGRREMSLMPPVQLRPVPASWGPRARDPPICSAPFREPSVLASCSTYCGFLPLECLLLVSSPLEWGPSQKAAAQLPPVGPTAAHICFPRLSLVIMGTSPLSITCPLSTILLSTCSNTCLYFQTGGRGGGREKHCCLIEHNHCSIKNRGEPSLIN